METTDSVDSKHVEESLKDLVLRLYHQYDLKSGDAHERGVYRQWEKEFYSRATPKQKSRWRRIQQDPRFRRMELDDEEVLQIVLLSGDEEVHHVKIGDLNADLIDCDVEISCQVVGEATQKAVPKAIELSCSKCSSIEIIDYSDLDDIKKATFLKAVVFGKTKDLTALASSQECENGSHNWRVRVTDYMDFSILFVRDLIDPLVKFDSRVYQTRKFYLVGQTVPYAKKVTVQGRVYLESSTKNITVIAENIEPYEDEITRFTVTEEDKENWTKYFQENSPEKLRSQIAPGMVGRPLVQEALLLTLHSISVIPDVHGRPIRGCLRTVFYGDTKTYKSKSAMDLTTDHYALGDYISGETSSRSGITYTIDADNKALIWGALPLNDLGLLVIDGLHSIHKDEWRETREALESQRVIVRRSQSGEALARARIVAIINPGMKDHKPLNTYPFSCLAIRDTYVFNDPPDVTRWDLFLPFSNQDVPMREIAEAMPGERPIPDNVFVRHVFWAWSRKPDDIIYEDAAVRKIKEHTVDFMEGYNIDDIPVVHLGYREVITRVSVAYAALMHSTDMNHEKIIVKEEHVEKAADFLDQLSKILELDEYKLEREGRLKIVPEELEEIISDLDSTSLRILDLIKVEPKSSRILADHLGVEEKTVKRRYAKLIKHGLVTTARGKGVEITPRGILFLRGYTRDIGTKTVPCEGKKGDIGTENVPMSLENTIPPLNSTERQKGAAAESEEEYAPKGEHGIFTIQKVLRQLKLKYPSGVPKETYYKITSDRYGIDKKIAEQYLTEFKKRGHITFINGGEKFDIHHI